MKNTILSDAYTDLVSDASKDIPTWINTDAPGVPKLFREYVYPVSSWPVIIDQEKATELSQLSTRILKLITQIPSLYFNNDEQKIADHYFEGNTTIAQLAMLSHKNDKSSCNRLDLTYTADGFKILEANIGSSIGGWQVQSFKEIIKGLHPTLDDKYKAINTQHKYYEFLVGKVLENVHSVGKELNIYVSMEEGADGVLLENIVEFLNDLLKITLKQKNLTGQLHVGSLTELQLANNTLQHKGKRMHCVLNMSGEEITPSIFRAFLMNAIYFPDHLGVVMYRDKGNLGLLRELAELKKFSPEDNEMVLKAVPWTTSIKAKQVLFNGTSYNLESLLRDQRENLVIKAAYGYQGKDVFIGKFSSVDEWEEAIQLALKEEGKFIAQEFSDSINFIAPDPNNQWAEHKLIWGSFGFGDIYGGVWVRMSALKTDVGVINSATGAVEAIVYEKCA